MLPGRHRLPRPPRARTTTTGERARRRRPRRPHHPPVVRRCTTSGRRDLAPRDRPAPGGDRARSPCSTSASTSSCNNRPSDPRRASRGRRHGRHVLQAVHDVQEAPQPDVLGQFICQAMEEIAAPGRPDPAPLRERRRHRLPREQGDRRGPVEPRHFPPTCPDWTEEEAINRAIRMGAMTGCPVYVVHLRTRSASSGSSGPRPPASGCGPRRAPVPPVHRGRDGALGAARQDGAASAAGRRPRPRRAVAGLAGAHRHRRQRPSPRARRPPRSRAGRTSSSTPRACPSPFGAPPRDAGASHVQRGRGGARAAHHLDGSRARREPGADVRALSPQGRDPSGRRRRPS